MRKTLILLALLSATAAHAGRRDQGYPPNLFDIIEAIVHALGIDDSSLRARPQ